MMRPDAKVQKVYLYPKPVDFRKSINGLAALVELDIKVEVFNPVLFVFLNRTRSQVKILYWERNGFCLWLTPSLAWRYDVEGYAPSPAPQFVEGRQAVTLAVNFDYLERYNAAVSYTDFFGGDFNPQTDRDFISFTLGAKF
ncbi:IS66 family insertion sequence element accessory protein TnpB [Pseudomonas aeruginosa]|uniref:IS66 family insertion sequence element accessory protein TnpB n=1 Tax=Pseudomonas aeruginosa TaxID=287 RepID=UPI001A8F1AA5|nr:IS66 family insertion sequence element accessory protein TnpB [Pseudomonas aeruginosa]MBN9906681.1 IS66 family insertion sequence element accessory protein TnpB [Pseudomonas aeruginosa]